MCRFMNHFGVLQLVAGPVLLASPRNNTSRRFAPFPHDKLKHSEFRAWLWLLRGPCASTGRSNREAQGSEGRRGEEPKSETGFHLIPPADVAPSFSCFGLNAKARVLDFLAIVRVDRYNPASLKTTLAFDDGGNILTQSSKVLRTFSKFY